MTVEKRSKPGSRRPGMSGACGSPFAPILPLFELKLDLRLCVSCEECLDACGPFAIGMREGARQPIQELVGFIVVDGEREIDMRRKPLAAFPFLARPERCDGCGECARLCPTDAIQVVPEIMPTGYTVPTRFQ